MISIVPTSTTASWYEETVTLDSREWLLRFMWSERERHWYLDVETMDGLAIAIGRKIVVGVDLLGGVTMDDRPPGLFVAVDMSGAGLDPDLRDLGARVLIYYIDGEHLA